MRIQYWIPITILPLFVGCSASQDLLGLDRQPHDHSMEELEMASPRDQTDSSLPSDSERVVEMPMSKAEVAPKAQSTASSTATKPVVPLDELDLRLDHSHLPPLYQAQPQVPESSRESQGTQKPAYKVIKVGQEEIRVLDSDMGAVDPTDLEKLRTQVSQ